MNIKAQHSINASQALDGKQQGIITISALTAKGDLESLQKALNSGLDAGLTVNQIKEILVHIVDDERIFSYRALRFARNEQENLIGFDQDAYALYSEADKRSLESIFEEYKAVRQSTITLFNNLPENSLLRMGHGTGSFNDATVRALVYHIAGHEQHHINFIKKHYL